MFAKWIQSRQDWTLVYILVGGQGNFLPGSYLGRWLDIPPVVPPRVYSDHDCSGGKRLQPARARGEGLFWEKTGWWHLKHPLRKTWLHCPYQPPLQLQRGWQRPELGALIICLCPPNLPWAPCSDGFLKNF